MKPWIAKSAVDFLEARKADLSDLNVFEWGSGASTAWWSRVARSVTSIEHDHEWAVKARKWSSERARVIEIPLGEKYWLSINWEPQTPDFVVIDGRHRKRCAEEIFHLPELPSAILWDDSQRSWYQAGMTLFQESDWGKLDFQCDLGGGRVTRIYVNKNGKLKGWLE